MPTKGFIMKENTEKKPLPTVKQRLLRIILFTVYPAYILHSLVVAPLFTICDSNVGVPEAITVALYFLFVLIDILVFFISFSVIIYGMCEMPLKDMRGILILIFLSPFFKYVLKFLISLLIDGIPTVDSLTMDIFSYTVSGILEILQYVIVIFLSFSSSKKYRELRLLANNPKFAESKTNRNPLIPAMPFKKIISLKNPLQLGAFFSALVLIIGRVASLAINDIANHWEIVGINQYLSFFAPYVLEIIIGAVGYFLMLYIYILIYSSTANNE